MAQILLVEDDKTIRIATEFALTQAGYEVSVAADGAQGFETAKKINPDIILLDLMLPKMSGFEVAERLRKDGNDVPIIMLTALDREEDKIKGLDAGADDYITKPFSTKELLARVRANLRRVRPHENETKTTIEVGNLCIDTQAARVTVAGQTIDLRSKEYALLLTLATHPGVLCTRDWIANQVWGEEFLSTSRTIDTHVRRVRKAINKDGWSYIQTAHGMGYRFEPKHKEDTNEQR